jgi:hypothetical protein
VAAPLIVTSSRNWRGADKTVGLLAIGANWAAACVD